MANDSDPSAYFAFILPDGDEKVKPIPCGVWFDPEAATFHLKNFKRWHNGVTVRAIRLDFYRKWSDANTQPPARSEVLRGRALRNKARAYGVQAVLRHTEAQAEQRQATIEARKERKERALQRKREFNDKMDRERAEFKQKMANIHEQQDRVNEELKAIGEATTQAKQIEDKEERHAALAKVKERLVQSGVARAAINAALANVNADLEERKKQLL
jgi:hypothetical protein